MKKWSGKKGQLPIKCAVQTKNRPENEDTTRKMTIIKQVKSPYFDLFLACSALPYFILAKLRWDLNCTINFK